MSQVGALHLFQFTCAALPRARLQAVESPPLVCMAESPLTHVYGGGKGLNPGNILSLLGSRAVGWGVGGGR